MDNKINKIERIGFLTALFGMALVLIWIGIFKFTPTEAKGIKGFVENSPLMSWMYSILSVSAVSKFIGVIEIITGILLILQPVSAKLGFIGSIVATIIFITTLSFIVTTPGAFSAIDGVWIPDQFLLKDFMALGLSIYTAAISAKHLNLAKVKTQAAPAFANA